MYRRTRLHERRELPPTRWAKAGRGTRRLSPLSPLSPWIKLRLQGSAVLSSYNHHHEPWPSLHVWQGSSAFSVWIGPTLSGVEQHARKGRERLTRIRRLQEIPPSSQGAENTQVVACCLDGVAVHTFPWWPRELFRSGQVHPPHCESLKLTPMRTCRVVKLSRTGNTPFSVRMSLEKKLVVFVGGSSGIGFEAVKSLLSSTTPYHIVLGSRSPLDPQRDLELQFSLQSSHSTLERLDCNFSSYASVKAFASTVKTRYTDPIAALVLCAGMIPIEYRKTQDGEHDILQVNVLSHALLLDLMADNLSPTAHVVLVSSLLFLRQKPGAVTPDNLEIDQKESFDYSQAYQHSKLLQVYLTYIADERFKKTKPGVSFIALCPGFIPVTGLQRELPVRTTAHPDYEVVTVETGAAVIRRGVEDDLPSGTFINEKGVQEVPGAYKDANILEEWRKWFVGKKVWEVGRV